MVTSGKEAGAALDAQRCAQVVPQAITCARRCRRIATLRLAALRLENRVTGHRDPKRHVHWPGHRESGLYALFREQRVEAPAVRLTYSRLPGLGKTHAVAAIGHALMFSPARLRRSVRHEEIMYCM